MKNLKSMNTSAFYNCIIDEFDAPHLNSITVDLHDFRNENITFTIGKKNFENSPGIL